MTEQDKKSSGSLIALVVVVALLAAGAFYYFSTRNQGANDAAPSSEQAAVVNEEPVVQGEVPPQPETPHNDVVVQTKTLDLPSPTPAETAAAQAVVSPADVEAMMGPRSIGSADAPIKMTEYASLTCSHCAAFHKEVYPALKAKFIDTGRVQLSFKEFPLNPPALDGSMILRCMPADKYVSFMDLLFSEQENWAFKPDYKDVLRQSAKLAGMSDEQFDACLANTALKNRIVADMKAGSDKYKTQSTPSFVINDGQETLVGDQPLAEFEQKFNAISPAGASPVPAPAVSPEQAAPAAEPAPAQPSAEGQ